MRFNRMSEITSELGRPAKVVVWGWALLVLLFLATVPVVGMPRTVYVIGGTLYSLFLVVITTGLALLGTPNRQRAMMVMLAAIFAGWGSLLLLLLFRPSLGVFGSILLASTGGFCGCEVLANSEQAWRECKDFKSDE